jgi:hypothetical protein
MADFSPVQLRVLDSDGSVMLDQSVPFTVGMTAREVLERAFLMAQDSDTPDPFVFTLRYYGYSQSPQFPGYLGYEIESIGQHGNSPQFFWDLLVDGVPSSTGADTTRPRPGATVAWQYTPVPATPAAVGTRAAHIQGRRAGKA